MVKKVSFADPIATELKPPKSAIPDDSIMLIKGNNRTELQYSTTDHFVSDLFLPNHKNPVASKLGEAMAQAVEEGLTNDNSFQPNSVTPNQASVEDDQVVQHNSPTPKVGLHGMLVSPSPAVFLNLQSMYNNSTAHLQCLNLGHCPVMTINHRKH
jgi:hypothetical protein